MTPIDPAEVVATDPMMRTLRARHPDVNIVLLPPVEPIRDREPATRGQCEAWQRHADAVLESLSRQVERDPTTRVDYWWSQSHPELRRWVTAASFADVGDEALPLLRAIGNLLIRLGWEPRAAADGSPRLRGAAGPFELIASASEGSLSVEITSQPLYVPQQLHDELGVRQ